MKEQATRGSVTDAGSEFLNQTRATSQTPPFVFMLPHFLEAQRVNYVVSVSLCVFFFSFFELHSVVSLAFAARNIHWVGPG